MKWLYRIAAFLCYGIWMILFLVLVSPIIVIDIMLAPKRKEENNGRY